MSRSDESLQHYFDDLLSGATDLELEFDVDASDAADSLGQNLTTDRPPIDDERTSVSAVGHIREHSDDVYTETHDKERASGYVTAAIPAAVVTKNTGIDVLVNDKVSQEGGSLSREHGLSSRALEDSACAAVVDSSSSKRAASVVSRQTQMRSLAQEKKRQLQSLLASGGDDVDGEVNHSKRQLSATPIGYPSKVALREAEATPQLHVGQLLNSDLDEKIIHALSPDMEVSAVECEVNLAADVNKLEALLEWGENGRPLWAESAFDALLFKVSGLTLAVPLIALGQIVKLNDQLTPIFGQSDWFMGLLPTPLGQLKTVNTALFVMPERYSDTFLDAAEFVISLDGQPWGLAVDSVTQPITLQPNDVNWRSQRTSRPWLAGTVKSAMCALIDIPQMARLLNSADASMVQKDKN